MKDILPLPCYLSSRDTLWCTHLQRVCYICDNILKKTKQNTQLANRQFYFKRNKINYIFYLFHRKETYSSYIPHWRKHFLKNVNVNIFFQLYFITYIYFQTAIIPLLECLNQRWGNTNIFIFLWSVEENVSSLKKNQLWFNTGTCLQSH